jgi:protein ImuB
MFAVLHIPGFALQSLIRTEPALASHPIVLRRTDEATVALCNDRASAAGVCPGQSLSQATARCPGLIIHAPRPALEREAEATLLAAAFSVCPQVELAEPGTCTLGLSGLVDSRHVPALQRALTTLANAGLEAGVGTGTTPLRALYAARHAQRGQILHGTPALLATLPLAVAEPSSELAMILESWGIKTLGQLTALTKADVTQRLGRSGLALWERANGGITRPLAIKDPVRTFSAALDCEHELETIEPLLFIFRRFVDRLALELSNAALSAQALELALELSDETTHTYLVRLPEPMGDADILFRALHTYLETLRTAAPIKGVRLNIIPQRSQVRQRGLFDGGLRDPHGFADTLARVMALVGSDQVGTPISENSHRPDAFKLISPPPVLTSLPVSFSHAPCGFALRRHRPPLPATIELQDRQPTFVWTAGPAGAICAVAGPWQASGDWWEKDRAWQREEWDVELVSGGLYRLVRTPAGWFVEGEYD